MPISGSSLLLFVTGALIVLAIPGPAVMYIVSRSVGHGGGAGLVSAAGIAVGTLVHILAETLGLSALLVSSALAFEAVKYVGAAYLIFLGIRTLRRADEPVSEDDSSDGRLKSFFWQGVVTNVLNPKSALFFLAFLPQFVDPSRGQATLQIFQLGMLFALMGWCTDSLWAVAAGMAAQKIRRNLRLRRAQRWISGGGLIALGLASAFSGARSK
jgi:threonine/homoserine/homoserine lactone efflux protein